MMKRFAIVLFLLVVGTISFLLIRDHGAIGMLEHHEAGDALDSLDHVVVYYNGGMNATSGRNTVDGYNIGLKYQCVEFVKRYYFEHFHHRMPNTYGNAKDFFDPAIADGDLNPARGLLQFRNNSASKPDIGDLLVLDGWTGNPFGHVAIISSTEDGKVEVVQQNTGSTRNTYALELNDGLWRIDSPRMLGWLRMP